jgi:nucleoside-diphosphate-sugar epimerase
VIRPGCVYGLRGGLTGTWFASALKDGAATVAGDGKNRWAVVHVEDLAELYVRAAESGLSGELLNATDRSRFTVGEMAAAASRAAGAGGKVRLLDAAAAEKAFGFMSKGMMLDQHVDSSKAVRLLGWAPRFGGFAEQANRHFAAWKASSR